MSGYVEIKEFKIPLRNNKKEVIDFAIVDEKYFDYLNQFKWHLDCDNYATGEVIFDDTDIKKLITMHLHIFYHLEKNKPMEGLIVDHSNKKRLDNTIANLQYSTFSDNARNRTKNKGTTSKYYGVCFSTHHELWMAYIQTSEGKKKVAYYKEEEYAALQYNIWQKEHFPKLPRELNNIDDIFLETFVPYVEKPKQFAHLPKSISMRGFNCSGFKY
jgi:hypothetical protein